MAESWLLVFTILCPTNLIMGVVLELVSAWTGILFQKPFQKPNVFFSNTSQKKLN